MGCTAVFHHRQSIVVEVPNLALNFLMERSSDPLPILALSDSAPNIHPDSRYPTSLISSLPSHRSAAKIQSSSWPANVGFEPAADSELEYIPAMEQDPGAGSTSIIEEPPQSPSSHPQHCDFEIDVLAEARWVVSRESLFERLLTVRYGCFEDHECIPAPGPAAP